MHLHVEPLTATLRAYDAEGDFEAWRPFSWAATLVWCGPDEVLIVALRGTLTPGFRTQIRDKLRSMGVSRVRYLRRGRDVRRADRAI